MSLLSLVYTLIDFHFGTCKRVLLQSQIKGVFLNYRVLSNENFEILQKPKEYYASGTSPRTSLEPK